MHPSTPTRDVQSPKSALPTPPSSLPCATESSPPFHCGSSSQPSNPSLLHTPEHPPAHLSHADNADPFRPSSQLPPLQLGAPFSRTNKDGAPISPHTPTSNGEFHPWGAPGACPPAPRAPGRAEMMSLARRSRRRRQCSPAFSPLLSPTPLLRSLPSSQSENRARVDMLEIGTALERKAQCVKVGYEMGTDSETDRDRDGRGMRGLKRGAPPQAEERKGQKVSGRRMKRTRSLLSLGSSCADSLSDDEETNRAERPDGDRSLARMEHDGSASAIAIAPADSTDARRLSAALSAALDASSPLQGPNALQLHIAARQDPPSAFNIENAHTMALRSPITLRPGTELAAPTLPPSSPTSTSTSTPLATNQTELEMEGVEVEHPHLSDNANAGADAGTGTGAGSSPATALPPHMRRSQRQAMRRAQTQPSLPSSASSQSCSHSSPTSASALVPQSRQIISATAVCSPPASSAQLLGVQAQSQTQTESQNQQKKGNGHRVCAARTHAQNKECQQHPGDSYTVTGTNVGIHLAPAASTRARVRARAASCGRGGPTSRAGSPNPWGAHGAPLSSPAASLSMNKSMSKGLNMSVSIVSTPAGRPCTRAYARASRSRNARAGSRGGAGCGGNVNVATQPMHVHPPAAAGAGAGAGAEEDEDPKKAGRRVRGYQHHQHHHQREQEDYFGDWAAAAMC